MAKYGPEYLMGGYIPTIKYVNFKKDLSKSQSNIKEEFGECF